MWAVHLNLRSLARTTTRKNGRLPGRPFAIHAAPRWRASARRRERRGIGRDSEQDRNDAGDRPQALLYFLRYYAPALVALLALAGLQP